MLQEKMVTISFSSESDNLEVSRLVKLAEGNVEKFRELCKERFQTCLPILNASDSRLTRFDSSRLIMIN